MALKNPIFKDGMAVAAGQAATALLSLAASAIIARSLPVADMGRYQLVLAYAAVAAITGLPGMALIINKGALKNYDVVLWPVMRRTVLCSFLGAALLFGAGWFCHVLWDMPDLGLTLMLVALFTPLQGLDKYDAFLKGKRAFVASNTIRILASLLYLVLVGGISWWTGSYLYALGACFAARALTLTFGFLTLRRRYKTAPRDPGQERELLHQGWKQSSLSVLNVTVSQLDKIVIGSLDPALLALYHVGATVPKNVKMTMRLLLAVPVNHWGVRDRKGNLHALTRHVRKAALLGAALALGLAVGAPVYVPLIFGPQYHDSVHVAIWLSLLALSSPIVFPIIQYDVNQNQGNFYMRLAATRQISFTVLLLTLVPLFAINGVICAMLAAEAIMIGGSLAFLRKEYHQLSSVPDRSA